MKNTTPSSSSNPAPPTPAERAGDFWKKLQDSEGTIYRQSSRLKSLLALLGAASEKLDELDHGDIECLAELARDLAQEIEDVAIATHAIATSQLIRERGGAA